MKTQTEALKLALEALEKSIDNSAANTQHTKAITAIKEALAQPEQEPVAIVDANDEGYWAEILPDRSVIVGQHLYAEAPQRKPWVEITRGQIDSVMHHADKHNFAWAVEAICKANNGSNIPTA